MAGDTIAAIATGLMPGGIGIVRVSGDEAVKLCAPLIRISNTPLEKAEANRLYYSHVFDGENCLDEAMTAVFRGPHSFTAEDTVEIQCHGGPHVLERILQAVLKRGVRLAEPGEFSKRAFLNGRLDLSEAEAIMDLIGSDNEFARETALSQLQGRHSELIRSLRARILEETAFIEAALDDPEHYSLEGYPEELRPRILKLREELRELIGSFDNGRRLKEGIETAILGKPNVGKSSLLNALLGEERAIVTSVAGTTRDTVEETLRLGELQLNIADTAGIRQGGDEIERLGMERSEKKARESELILCVLDGSRELDEDDRRVLASVSGKKALILINKTDLEPILKKNELEESTGLKVLSISAKTGEGLKELEKAVEELFVLGEIREKPLVFTNLRHKKLLEEADTALARVLESLELKMPEDFFSVDLMDAYRALGLILGEEADDDLVNEIFGKFCMGK